MMVAEEVASPKSEQEFIPLLEGSNELFVVKIEEKAGRIIQ
jgi:hypothetical protein